jgi:hypothetical protein
MKREIYLLLVLINLMLGLGYLQAQVTISGGSSVNGPYTTVAAAITALNGATISGPVTVDVIAGHTETLTGKITMTATGTLANPIVIQKSGAGANPVLTSYVGTVATPSVIADGFWVLAGSDYVTIDGIDLQESAANTDVTTQMEFGYGLFKASVTDGCQNNTIKNCTITLNRLNNTAWTAPGHNGSTGIAVLNGLYTATGAVTPTAASGSNSFNKFYSNTIQNCNAGIAFVGFAATAGVGPTPDPLTFLGDLSNDVGGIAAPTGNTILNFGGGAATNPATGIFANSQWSFNCSYNSVNSNTGAGVNHPTTLRGIFLNSSSTSASVDCNFNTVTIAGGATTSSNYAIDVEFGSTAASNTININNNTVQNCTYPTATSGIFYGIYVSTSATNVNVNNNTLNNINLPGTGSLYGIYNSSSPVNFNLMNNTITNLVKTGTSGTMYGVYTGSPQNGVFSGNTIDGLTFSNPASTSGTIAGIYNISSGQNMRYTSNTVRNVSQASSLIFYGIREFGSSSAAYVKILENNQVYNVFTTPGGAGGFGTVYCISNATNSITRISGNLIHSINSTGTTGGTGGTIYPIYVSSGTTDSVFNNKVYNISSMSTGPTIAGINIAGTTSSTHRIYNNYFGDLRAPNANTSSATSPTIRGMSFTSTSTTSTLEVSFNTVYLNASSANTNFSTTALWHTTSTTATTMTLNLRNNILVNLSTPKGTGFTVAYQRSSTSLTNYGSVSNNNLFYAGSPCVSRLIYYDGTNADQTLAAYKARVAPRDAASVTEEPPFLSTMGSSTNFLHINTAVPTQIEGGGIPVATITTDYDGDTRNATTPDIGADEFTGTPSVPCAGTPTAGTATATPAAICANQSTTICLTGQTVASGISIQWKSSATSGGPYTDIVCEGASCYNTGPLAVGTYYYIATITCANSGLSANTNEVTVVVNANPTVTVLPTAANVCLGTPTTLTASGAVTYTWSPAAGLNTTSGPVVVATPTVSTTYTVVGADAIGCIASATSTITVVPAPIVTATATPASVCSGGSSQLQATITSAPIYSVTPITHAPIARPGSGVTDLVIDGVANVALTSGSLDDGYWNPIALPFSFNLYGTGYTMGTISTNGNLHFGTATASGYGSTFPNASTPNATVAGVFADLDLTNRAGAAKFSDLYYFTDGVSPNRRFVISFVDAGFYNSGSAQTTFTTFQIILFETSNNIEFHTSFLDNTTTTKIQGIENSGGTAAITVTGRNGTAAWTGVPDAYQIASLYTYSWSPATYLSSTTIANPMATNVTATTTYTVTVTSSNGCFGTAMATVTVSQPTAFNVTGGGSFCTGGNGVSLGLSGSEPGVNYQLFNGATPVGSPLAGTGSAIDFGLQTAAGTYTVVATNITTTCTSNMTGSATVTIDPLPTTFTVNGGGAYCAGGAGLPVGLSGSETGVNYQLQIGGVNTGSPVAGTGSALSFGSQTTAGTYTVVATNATTSCTNNMTGSAVITIDPLPTAFSVTGGGAYCAGGTGVPVGLSGSETGVEYQLQIGGVNTGSPVSGTGSAISFGNQTAAGTYTVVATNTTTTCTSNMTGSATVTINPLPGLSETHILPTSCLAGNGSIDLTVTGAVPTILYSWTGPSGYSASSEDISLLNGGFYYVTVTNGDGCQNTLTVNLDLTPTCTSCPPLTTAPANVTFLNSTCDATCNVSGGSITAPTGTPCPVGSTLQYRVTVGGVPGAWSTTLPVYAQTGPAQTIETRCLCDADLLTASPMSAAVTTAPGTCVNPTAFTVTGGGAYCAGGTGVPVGLSGSETGVEYQLQIGGVNTGGPVSGTGSAISFGNQTAAGIYTVVATNATTTCTSNMTGSVTVTINPLPTAFTVTGGGAYCAGGAGVAVGLSGSQTGINYQLQIGGVNTGSPVSGTGSALSFGNQTVAGIYTVVATNATTTCTSNMTGSVTVTINPLPTAFTVTGGGAYCTGGAGVAVGLSGSQTGINYQLQIGGVNTGGPVSGTGSALSFGNQTAAGIYTVVATNTTTLCTSNMTGSVTVTVNPLPTVFAVTGGGARCATDNVGLPVGLSGSQTGVNYQLLLNGSPVGAAVAGTGAALAFPVQLAVGTYTVNATNATTLCAQAMSGSVIISTFNCTVSISDPCACKNNATTLTNGQFDETIEVSAPAGQVWTVTAVSGLFASSSAAPPAAPTAITVGTPMTFVAPSTYRLTGIHIDAIGYSLTVSNGRGVSLSIGNTCAYPNPVITAPAGGPFCLNTPVITLTGNPGDANIVSQGFTVNGVSAAVFNARTLGIGSHTVVYTVNGGVPKASGATDPGCVQSVSATFQVVATPSNVACNDRVQISLDEDCEIVVTPDMILEGTYYCYDDYSVELIDRGRVIPNLLNASHIGRVITTKVTHLPSGNYCWGTLTVEDKMKPLCPAQTPAVELDCTQDPGSVPPPAFTDNCDRNLRINLINERRAGDACGVITITRVWIATDAAGNDSEPCTQTIRINNALVTFPEDVTWTCEQYAYNRGIVGATALHPLIRANAAAMDRALLCCIAGLDGDDVAGVNPFQTGTEWWKDQEDLDVVLDPRYDDNVDNPATDGDARCNTVTGETDNLTTVENFSFTSPVGCPYLYECRNLLPNGHYEVFELPDFRYVPTPVPANHRIRGLEDADVLAATGSGVPNVLGQWNCNFAVTWQDVKLEACEGIDTNVVFKILRTWTVLNWCTGEVTTDIQVIKVIDKKAPEIVFDIDLDGDGIINPAHDEVYDDQLESDKIIGGSHPECASSGIIAVPTITDDCTGIDRIRVFTPVGQGIPVTQNGQLIGWRIPAPYLPMGNHTFTFEATDGCGNISTATWRFTVIDGIPPVPICREVTQVALGSDGLAKVGAKYFDEGSYDNCGSVYFKVLKMEENTCAKANIDKQGEKDDNHEWFDDEVIFCCDDIQFDAAGKQVPVIVILRVYDTDPGLGAIATVRSTGVSYLSHKSPASALNNSRYNDCMIEVYVEDKHRPTCEAPKDIWTTCLEIPDNLNYQDTTLMDQLFGKVTIYDNCGATTKQTVTPNLDVCGVGSITRSWVVTDKYGNRGLRSCFQTIMVSKVIDYDLRIPADFDADCRTASPVNFTTLERGCDLMAITKMDKEVPISNGGECKKIIRTWTIIDWCDYDGFSAAQVLPRLDVNQDGNYGDAYTLVSDGTNLYRNSRFFSNSNGYYTYEQHIKIYDGEAPILTKPAKVDFCGGELEEDPCTGLVDLIPVIDEKCTPDEVTVQHRIDANNDGTYDIPATGRANGKVNRRLPLGTHRVHFWVADGCGNTSEIDIIITVRDCKVPTVICINGLSAELMPDGRGGGMVEIWAKDWDASSKDNCSAIKLYVNRILDRDGDGLTCFDEDDYQTTVPTTQAVSFTCDDLGCQGIQLWACDAAGNCDYCVTFVDIQDNRGVCSGSKVALGGKVANEDNESVEDVKVELSTGEQAVTGTDGEFNFAVVPGGDYTVTPSRDDNPLNGVTTFDLVLISKHILNVQKLNSPYKVIAADANNSQSVTTLDLVALRKLILRIDNSLPNNTSWRFVEKSYRFPNAQNPWTAEFPEVKNINNISADELNADFVAIKVGDVNGSATPNSLLGVDVRSFNGNLVFSTEEQRAKAGEEIRVALVANQDVQGYQFTLTYDSKAVELVGIESGVAKEGNFNVNAGEGAITTSWNEEQPVAGQTMFTLVLKAKSEVELSKVLGVSSEYTAAEAYNASGELMGIAIEFNNGAVATAGFQLYQNTPNPFKGETTIGFNLPEASTATMTISDVTGKVLKVVKGNYAKGYNAVVLKRSELGAVGVLTYELATPTDSGVKKMILVD